MLLGLSLLLWPALAPALDGDADVEGEENDGSIARIACRIDEDCGEGEVCREEGFCVPLKCGDDTECLYPDFRCRKDGVCAPKKCVLDSDCLPVEFCIRSSCVSDPTAYVEGGVANCRSFQLNSRWEQLGTLLIALVFLLWLRSRKNLG